MKKAKIKKRRDFWIVYTDRKNRAICYSLEAAQMWRVILGGGEKQCRS
jgi:hypothetical protein